MELYWSSRIINYHLIFNCETSVLQFNIKIVSERGWIWFRGREGRRPSTHRATEGRETSDRRERERNQKKGTKNGKPTQSKETKNGKQTIARAKLKKDN